MPKIKLPKPKICKDCKIILTDLNRIGYCSDCKKRYSKSDKGIEQRKKWVNKNPDKMKAIMRRYIESHREHLRITARKYYRENKEKVLANHRKYYRENKEKFRKYYKKIIKNDKNN